MAKKQPNKQDTPVFVVKLEKGLADRQRLPLAHVISVLEEVRQMIIDAGRDIQHDIGMEKGLGDFGLELVAGREGMIFQPGSVQAQIAITSNVRTGVLAARRVVETVTSLSKRTYTARGETDRSLVRRLNRIAQIREKDKTQMRLILQRPGSAKPEQAVFGEAAAAAAWTLQAPYFEMEGMILYGRLFELRDNEADEEGRKAFWGELRLDTGEKWRIQFKPGDIEKVVALFRKYVTVTGTARYHRIQEPKLLATDISADQERDYEKAFDELFGRDREAYGDDFAGALKELRGE